MLKTVYSSRCKHQVKRLKKSGKDMDSFYAVLTLLENEIPLPPEYKDHELHGKLEGTRELHIEPDWLLLYEIFKNELVLHLVSTGTHRNTLRK
ncbi:MAG: type II toxin-antitoxin system YafQ family toxin [Ruminococcus sp.]|jgi:mRNA interferase YafQ|nr:type II toxin-antitoxin system YafQ family toxin [Ruminococcus sp.]